MLKEVDCAGVVIGRFQGFTSAHLELFKAAAAENDRVVVLVGSANRRKSIKNPWSAEERIDAIKFCMEGMKLLDKMEFIPINDYPEMYDWVDNVYTTIHDKFVDDVITLYGCDKDDSSFYLKHFPGWELKLIDVIEGFDATEVRRAWFEGKQTLHYLRENMVMHPKLGMWLFAQPYNDDIQAEWNFYENEASRFSKYPFPETLTFCCADAVLIHDGHVLMIQRGAAPGKGCWALPGGFKNRNETFLQAAIRELQEETQIELTEKQLEATIRHYKMFDDPSRSLGIPRISGAYLFDVSSTWGLYKERPNVTAGDDACNVRWTPLEGIENLNDIYDDHQLIINDLIKFKD